MASSSAGMHEDAVGVEVAVRGDDGRSYRVVEKLGQGGFGSVYRARVEDASGVQRHVAVKVLRVDVPPEVVQRFRDEARMLGLVRHRAIVGLEGLVNLDGQLAAVLEFVPGVDLKAVIESGELPPVRVAIRLVEEVASALDAAWNQVQELTSRPLHLIHRDIKPANIRVTAGGEVRVVDFGGARAEFAEREAQTKSFVVGSYRYMAPERLDQVDTPRSDVYSLGLVLAELLAGDEVPTPSKHHGQHDGFLESLREVVEGRMYREGLRAQAPDVLRLLDAMLDYYPEHRPSARHVELAARVLLRKIDGPPLRVWAEETVPALEAARRSEATPIAGRRAIFPQSTDASEPAPSGLGRSTDPGATRLLQQRATPLARAPATKARGLPHEALFGLAAGAALLVAVVAHEIRVDFRPEPPAPRDAAVVELPAPTREWGPAAAPRVEAPIAASRAQRPSVEGPPTSEVPLPAEPPRTGPFKGKKKKK